jgi:hypothetical protein
MGEITWLNMQIVVNNYNLALKRLVFREPCEDDGGRVARFELRTQFKKAIRVYRDHVRREISLALEEANHDMVRMDRAGASDNEVGLIEIEIETDSIRSVVAMQSSHASTST